MTDWAVDKPAGFYLSSFRCVTAFVAQQVVNYAGPYPYIDGLLLQVTQKIGSIEVRHDPRRAGRSTYTLRRLIRLWLSAWVNFSLLPLRLATGLGLLMAAGAGAGSFSVLIGATAHRLPAQKRSFAAGLINAGGSLGQFVFAPGTSEDRVMEAALEHVGGFKLTIDQVSAGADHYRKHGRNIDPETLEVCRNADAVIKGPVGHPDVRNPDGTEAGLLGGHPTAEQDQEDCGDAHQEGAADDRPAPCNGLHDAPVSQLPDRGADAPAGRVRTPPATVATLPGHLGYRAESVQYTPWTGNVGSRAIMTSKPLVRGFMGRPVGLALAALVVTVVTPIAAAQ